MFPSEAEIEIRLAALRRRREALDREIADLALYRELGRRLGGSGPGLEPGAGPESEAPARPGHPAASVEAAPAPAWAAPAPLRPSPSVASRAGFDGPGVDRPAPDLPAPDLPVPDLPVQDLPVQDLPVQDLPVPPVAFEDDPVAARRYGRAVIEAAIGVLEAAGRPLHAGEILERLSARGFTLPGQDPVAALNTRLWKRAGPGGPVRRMGDAVYALAEP
ncbi:winged helix-turn-helix domain-containing protein [Methylobacterium planeticum]|uniref:HTH HARE-type domain-containing protein n=1 Tax=Methylobacterium planeticum TaxID=2615211 RepID=A0A6N6MK29_9HYPH|nr:winged helix-turn-helix domain-containing protein [Methylobacterium planeticum]KAB1070495.1 hypothetical protein F6X51_22445 [Methylobacterium planeticum]